MMLRSASRRLHVVEIGGNVAAPFATSILADLGARVLKIEPPHGDAARTWGPPFWDGSAAAVFQHLNRNKRGVRLDLKETAQRSRLRRHILRWGDVVVQNLRPRAVEALELDAQTLRARKPQLIYCNLGAYGHRGPLADRTGYDPLMQAFSGLMSVTGEGPGRPPVRVGTSIVDQGAGMWCVIGILAAWQRRLVQGEGCTIDTSLYETALTWMLPQLANYLASGVIPQAAGSSMGMIVPYQAFATADGYLMLAAANDRLFTRLAEALEQPDWKTDARFASNPQRVAHRAVLVPQLEMHFRRKATAAWIEQLTKAGVPVAPLQNVETAWQHPQTEALALRQAVPGTSMTQLALPLSFDGKRPQIYRRPPA